MVKKKYLGIIAIASTTFLFSGCVPQHDTFPNQHGYYNNSPRVNVSLFSYTYPYFYDRPYYFLNGLYYYGGFFHNGIYHYGNRRFRQGHFFNNGYRYYRGRRYRARNGVHGYYKNRSHYEASRNYRTKQRAIDRGRVYQSRDKRTVRKRSNSNVKKNIRSNSRTNKSRRNYIGSSHPNTGKNKSSRTRSKNKRRNRPVR